MQRSTALFLLLALFCLPFADLSLSSLDPWHELGRMGQGFALPQWPGWSLWLNASLTTLAFALQGVVLGAVLGFVLALAYGSAYCRLFCAFLRSIHELFWALLLIQMLGVSPLAGVLALAIPYAGTFAKIYGELYEEVNPAARRAVGGPTLSNFFYTVLPQAWSAMKGYTSYRFECGLRSAAVLGFVGLPTLGVHLEAALRQGFYAEAAAWFYSLLLLIVSFRLWLRSRLLIVWCVAAVLWLPPVAQLDWTLLWQFIAVDLLPLPLRDAEVSWAIWLGPLLTDQALPGLVNTLILASLALCLTGIFALLAFPMVSPLISALPVRTVGHGLLVLFRSAPEYFLTFIGLLLFGPSLLPALLALTLHNGAIVAFVVGQASSNLKLRLDAVGGMNRYVFEVMPRSFRHFFAFTLYRLEIIMRETAVLGMLGIPTLGFFIDSAFSEFRFDRALVLLLVTAALNMGVDAAARALRLRLHLRGLAEQL